jgi:hypothetical protein
MANFSKTANQVNTAFGPQQQAFDTQKLYAMLMGSPAFQAMLQNYSLQGNQLGQNLTAGMAKRGMTGTGVGTVMQGMGQSAAGFGQTQARGDLWQQAMQMALQSLMGRMGATTDIYKQQQAQGSFLGNMFGNLLGAGGALIPGLK